MADCKDTDWLIERLRSYDWVPKGTPRLFHKVPAIMAEAADALEAMQKENERLINAIADHVTVRAEKQQRIKHLEADLEAQEQVAITWMEMANDKDERIEQLESEQEELRVHWYSEGKQVAKRSQQKRIEQLEAERCCASKCLYFEDMSQLYQGTLNKNLEQARRIEQLEAALPVDYWEQNCLLREKQERIEQLEAELAESERQTRAQLSRVMKRDERIEPLEVALRQIIDYHDIGGEHVITCQRIAKKALGEKE